MNKIITPMLSIELTQKCNLDCIHCLNGEHKELFITKEIVEKIFDEVKYIDVLYFTGGEVFLAYEQMKMILNIAKKKNVQIHSCSMLTNGTIYDKRIYKLLKEYFKDNFEIGMSSDDYHDKSIIRIFKNNINVATENIKKNYYDKHSMGFKRAESILINTGCAKDLEVLKTEYEAIGYYYSYYKEYLLVGPIIFVGADGYITEGNLEILSRDDQSLGNILNEKIYDMVINGGININVNDINEFLSLMEKRNEDYQYRRGDHWRFHEHKMVPYEPIPLDDYYKELAKIDELISEIVSSDTKEEVIEKVLSKDFSSWPHDLSQIEHNQS